MERNELVLYLDIPEFSEALYASKWHSDIVLPQAGDNIYPESLLSEKVLAMLETVPASEVWEDLKDDSRSIRRVMEHEVFRVTERGFYLRKDGALCLHVDLAKIPCVRCRKTDESGDAHILSCPEHGTKKRKNPILFPEILYTY
ncbi:hypothetical protein NXW76_20560 [Bacteroides thetaiotaomicron]|nr:hypothetical protein [Bacteroides thetaiotaomicron]